MLCSGACLAIRVSGNFCLEVYPGVPFYGAAFTQVYANRLGERIVPTPDAKVTDRHKAAADGAGRRTPARPPGRAA